MLMVMFDRNAPMKVFRTGQNVVQWLLVGFVFENDVLLEHEPAIESVVAQSRDYPDDIDIAGAERCVDPGGYRLGESQLTGTHLRQQGRVDILEVNERDSVRNGTRQLHRIGSANGQVPSIQGQ